MGEKMAGKSTTCIRRLQMLEDLYENNSHEVLKRSEKDRIAWREYTRKKVRADN